MKSSLVSEVTSALEEVGYHVIDCVGLRSCFDLIAKRDRLLFIKVLANVDGLTRKACADLQHAASVTSAIPIVVGDHTKAAKLLDSVVYERYGVRVVNLETLKEVTHEKPPSVYSVRGNYCIRIDHSLLVRMRHRLELSQQELADNLGVSKQTVHRYEFSGRMSREVADKLMRFLEDDISLPEDIFSQPAAGASDESESNATSLKHQVLAKFRDLGFHADLTHAPFDIVAVEAGHERIFTAVTDDPRRLSMRLALMQRVCELVGGYGVCVSNRGEDESVPIIRPRDLWRIRDPEELFDLING
jgi:putative transcriptional regulator